MEIAKNILAGVGAMTVVSSSVVAYWIGKAIWEDRRYKKQQEYTTVHDLTRIWEKNKNGQH